jgi:hypothetical protein
MKYGKTYGGICRREGGGRAPGRGDVKNTAPTKASPQGSKSGKHGKN